jgi:protocatechuate 3,4-dioxygenase beta subunit
MKRKSFIKNIGLTGAAIVSPMRWMMPNAMAADFMLDCNDVPATTAGPYPLDLVSNSAMFRNTITANVEASNNYTVPGIPLTFTLTVLDGNCTPIPNARVDVWHSTRQGIYSGYSNTQNAGTTTSNYLRGIQLTDAAGQVTFNSIFPGWYVPRVTHIHVLIYIGGLTASYTNYSSNADRVTQFTFDDSVSSGINTPTNTYGYKTSYTYANTTDMVFGTSAMTTAQRNSLIMPLTGAAATGFTGTLSMTLASYILPLKLLSFEGGVREDEVGLWWATAEEQNVDRIEIERSENAKDYELIGTVKAKGNSSTVTNYSFVDSDPLAGKSFYRLKIIDMDGSTYFSQIVPVGFKYTRESVSLYHNNDDAQLIVNYDKAFGNARFGVVNMKGALVAKGELMTGTRSVIGTQNLPAGTYLFSIELGIDRYTFKFQKN